VSFVVKSQPQETQRRHEGRRNPFYKLQILSTFTNYQLTTNKMKKKESSLKNMLLSLLVVTLVAGFSLGYVNELTKEPKAKTKLQRKINALKLVLPEFDNNPVSDILRFKSKNANDSIEIFPAFSNHKFVGAAVVGSSENGFSGLIKIMVGFNPEAQVQNIVVLEQKETPGLGTKMKDEKFLVQFKNIKPATFKLKVKKDGGDVDAITGATISSRAFSEAVQMAYDILITEIDSIKNKK